MKMKRVENPMPTVEYDGKIYKLKSRKIDIPNFSSMDSLHVRVWLLKNTTPRGYSKKTNPLAGMGDVINII